MFLSLNTGVLFYLWWVSWFIYVEWAPSQLDKSNYLLHCKLLRKCFITEVSYSIYQTLQTCIVFRISHRSSELDHKLSFLTTRVALQNISLRHLVIFWSFRNIRTQKKIHFVNQPLWLTNLQILPAPNLKKSLQRTGFLRIS